MTTRRHSLVAVTLTVLALVATGCTNGSENDDPLGGDFESIVASSCSASPSPPPPPISETEWDTLWNAPHTTDLPSPLQPLPDPHNMPAAKFIETIFSLGKQSLGRVRSREMYAAFRQGFRGCGGGCSALLAYCTTLTYPYNNHCAAVATGIGCP